MPGRRQTVTKFAVKTAFLAKCKVQTAGAKTHEEYRIPADDLPDGNARIAGPIEVVAKFRG